MNSLPAAMRQTVTRVRETSSGEDDYGNPLPATEDRFDIAQTSLQPLLGTASTEANGADYDRIITRWKLFTPPGVDLVTTDRIQQGADVTTGVPDAASAVLDLEVDGDPVTWPGPDGLPHHIEVMLKKFGG